MEDILESIFGLKVLISALILTVIFVGISLGCSITDLLKTQNDILRSIKRKGKF